MTAPTEPTATPAQAPAQPTQPPSAPVPTPAQVFPPQQPQTAAHPDGPNGFPENTPLVEMTDKQQANYYKYHSRKHEEVAKARADYDDLKAKAAEFDKLQAAQMSEQQRLVAEAEQRTRSTVLAEVGPKAAEAALRTALHIGKGLGKAEIDAIVGPLNCNYFLADDGLTVDADKVTTYLATIAAPASATPTPPAVPAAVPQPAAPAAVPPPAAPPATGEQQPRPDMGQGNRNAPVSGGLEAGRAIARSMFGTSKPA
ncbi:hypothetical protein ABZY58_11725 [Micromonospora tulbaghiae]|uniref:hypothetical protein n=1 Tax=Micromonospora tulbaghiae TaxID=479978 RepID=UPI0033A19831